VRHAVSSLSLAELSPWPCPCVRCRPSGGRCGVTRPPAPVGRRPP
jgi:hypothetical protein